MKSVQGLKRKSGPASRTETGTSEKCQEETLGRTGNSDVTSTQSSLRVADRIDAVDLKNRLRDVETDRRDPLHADLLQCVVATAATTSMALTCR